MNEKCCNSRTKNDIGMKLGSVSNLEKRKNDNFNVMLTPMQGFPYRRMWESPFTSWKFVHPHSLNLYSSLPKVLTKIIIFTLYPKKTSFSAPFFNFILASLVPYHFNFNLILFLYTGHATFDFNRGSIFTCFFYLWKKFEWSNHYSSQEFIWAILMSGRPLRKPNLLIEFSKSIFKKNYLKEYWRRIFIQNKLA